MSPWHGEPEHYRTNSARDRRGARSPSEGVDAQRKSNFPSLNKLLILQRNLACSGGKTGLNMRWRPKTALAYIQAEEHGSIPFRVPSDRRHPRSQCGARSRRYDAKRS